MSHLKYYAWLSSKSFEIFSTFQNKLRSIDNCKKYVFIHALSEKNAQKVLQQWKLHFLINVNDSKLKMKKIAP